MKKFSLKKKIIIGIIGFLIIGIIGYVCFVLNAISNAFADNYNKIYAPNELPSDTFLLAVTSTKGGLDFIDYKAYQQDQQLSQPNFSLYKYKKSQTVDCGLKILCTIRKDDDEFIVDKRGLLNEGLTTTYKISENQIIPISMSCSSIRCSIDRKPPQPTP